MSRIHLCQQLIEPWLPSLLYLFVEQRLGSTHIGHIEDAIVALHVSDIGRLELLCQPLPAVDAHVHSERKPRLQAQMHETSNGVLKVEVVVQALVVAVLQLKLLLLAVSMHRIRPAWLHTAEHADQSVAHAIGRHDLPRFVLFAYRAACQIQQRSTCSLRQRQTRRANLLGYPLGVLHELFEPHLDLPQVRTHSARVRQQSQRSPQPHTIKPAEHPDDIPLVSLYKLIHGVPFVGQQ